MAAPRRRREPRLPEASRKRSSYLAEPSRAGHGRVDSRLPVRGTPAHLGDGDRASTRVRRREIAPRSAPGTTSPRKPIVPHLKSGPKEVRTRKIRITGNSSSAAGRLSTSCSNPASIVVFPPTGHRKVEVFFIRGSASTGTISTLLLRPCYGISPKDVQCGASAGVTELKWNGRPLRETPGAAPASIHHDTATPQGLHLARGSTLIPATPTSTCTASTLARTTPGDMNLRVDTHLALRAAPPAPCTRGSTSR
ncbi:uncharacterized protein LOC111674323 [Orussus abietinus]|uniref:uncharacterized protein LOC111674323 n=1 Tax=Orussus abietinus TaxID=222816 RepID=UPI000C716084|nr:uncharacterized protein LOC111674323 [Orussus abietinus]